MDGFDSKFVTILRLLCCQTYHSKPTAMPYGILISLFLLSSAFFSSGPSLSRLQQPNQPTTNLGWRPLFNGKDLAGWKHVGKGSMLVEKGLIHGKGGMGLLYYTKEKFGNCTLRVVYKMQKENSNAGVFIRIPVEPREEWMPVHYGYEVQIDNHPETSDEDEYHVTGTLYSLTKPLAKPGKPGPQWNTMDITLDGPRTIVYVNGVKVTDYREGEPVPARKFDFEPYRGIRPNSGYIGLQNHGDHDIVYFKEVSVKPLR